MVHDLIKVLMIDDCLEDRRIFRRFLEEDSLHHYIFLEASTKEEGLEIFKTQKVDIILLDYMLPDSDGLEILSELSEGSHLNDISVIFLTGQGNETVAVQAMKNGASDYLVKSGLTKDLLIRTINYAIEKEKGVKALRISEERNRALIKAMPDMIFRLTDKGVFFDYKGPQDDLIMSVDEIIGSNIADVPFPPQVKNSLLYFIEQARITGDVHIYEYEMMSSSGMQTYEARIVNSDENETVCFVRNITEQKQANEERKNLESQLIQAQKMEAVGVLAGGIAHDFNNILSPILGYSEMMKTDLPLDSPLQNPLQQIYTAAERARDLVKQILTFSRQSEQELKPIKVQHVLKEVFKLIRHSLPASIEIHQDISNNCGYVMADLTRIHQIIMNLITNAYHAMQETGGKLAISLKEVDLAFEDLNGSTMIPGTYICLTISDTGVGMENTIKKRIFDPYFTTKEQDKGTGLGLSVVHGIVKKYGGDIKVYSEPGKGSVFKIFLPEIENSMETKSTEKIDHIPMGNERILLVDDEMQVLEMEKLILERLGYQVTALNNSLIALEAFRSQSAKFDLVITDMTMPDMTGIQLVEELSMIRPDIRIIICTGFSEQISEVKASALGIHGFLTKPLIIGDLAKTIRRALKTDLADKSMESNQGSYVT